MKTIKGFRHVAVVVNDLDNMIRFYTQTLGFEVKRRFNIESGDFRNGIGIADARAKGAHLTVPNCNVEIELFQFETPLLNRSDLPLQPNHFGFRHMALIVDDLKETYLELRDKNGIHFLSEPIVVKEPEEVAGFQFVYFRDPEGNILELNQLPEWANQAVER
jgi:catechol 2,3-dioxygenase-like lactoylglutathione lyase family enzyme